MLPMDASVAPASLAGEMTDVDTYAGYDSLTGTACGDGYGAGAGYSGGAAADDNGYGADSGGAAADDNSRGADSGRAVKGEVGDDPNGPRGGYRGWAGSQPYSLSEGLREMSSSGKGERRREREAGTTDEGASRFEPIASANRDDGDDWFGSMIRGVGEEESTLGGRDDERSNAGLMGRGRYVTSGGGEVGDDGAGGARKGEGRWYRFRRRGDKQETTATVGLDV